MKFIINYKNVCYCEMIFDCLFIYENVLIVFFIYRMGERKI